MLGRVDEVVVRGQERQLVSDAELRKQGVDGTHLNPGPPADVPEFGRGDMVLTIWLEHRKRFEGFNDLVARRWARKSLEEFLKDKPSRDNDLVSQQGLPQGLYLRDRGIAVSSKAKRPDARVDEQAHFLVLSAL